jgi:hypothetical protein
MSELEEIRPGLWRWTARHPDWRPDAAPQSAADWPPDVGCVLCETADATVLIDPLVPSPGERDLLRRLDRRVGERGLPVAILTTIGFHRRSRDQLAERYGASTSRARRSLPAGIESFPISGAGETVFWLTAHRTLVPGDRILGAPGGGTANLPRVLAQLPAERDRRPAVAGPASAAAGTADRERPRLARRSDRGRWAAGARRRPGPLIRRARLPRSVAERSAPSAPEPPSRHRAGARRARRRPRPEARTAAWRAADRTPARLTDRDRRAGPPPQQSATDGTVPDLCPQGQ